MTKKHPIAIDAVARTDQGLADNNSGGRIQSASATDGIPMMQRRPRDLDSLSERLATRLDKLRASRRLPIAPDTVTAAVWGDKPPATPGITASNLKPISKGTLKGTVDIGVPKWRIVIRGCCWHEKNGKQWVSFPAREWIGPDGRKNFANIIEFSDRDIRDRFQAAALAAVQQLERSNTR
jgi:hypothetical protein